MLLEFMVLDVFDMIAPTLIRFKTFEETQVVCE